MTAHRSETSSACTFALGLPGTVADRGGVDLPDQRPESPRIDPRPGPEEPLGIDRGHGGFAACAGCPFMN